MWKKGAVKISFIVIVIIIIIMCWPKFPEYVDVSAGLQVRMSVMRVNVGSLSAGGGNRSLGNSGAKGGGGERIGV